VSQKRMNQRRMNQKQAAGRKMGKSSSGHFSCPGLCMHHINADTGSKGQYQTAFPDRQASKGRIENAE
jgi:hypothetical protein